MNQFEKQAGSDHMEDTVTNKDLVAVLLECGFEGVIITAARGFRRRAHIFDIKPR